MEWKLRRIKVALYDNDHELESLERNEDQADGSELR
jgi:hypothetical protein